LLGRTHDFCGSAGFFSASPSANPVGRRRSSVLARTDARMAHCDWTRRILAPSLSCALDRVHRPGGGFQLRRRSYRQWRSGERMSGRTDIACARQAIPAGAALPARRRAAKARHGLAAYTRSAAQGREKTCARHGQAPLLRSRFAGRQRPGRQGVRGRLQRRAQDRRAREHIDVVDAAVSGGGDAEMDGESATPPRHLGPPLARRGDRAGEGLHLGRSRSHRSGRVRPPLPLTPTAGPVSRPVGLSARATPRKFV
jgi:hypothetical protein